MRCEYCPSEGPGSYGENFEISTRPLAAAEVVWAVNVIGQLGFDTFRLTGGEPLLDVQRVASILRGVVAGQRFKNVRLNTNGSKLLVAIPKLSDIPLSALKVSLDTIDEKLFRQITKSSKHSVVLDGIIGAVKEGLPVEVNAVLTKETADRMMDLVDWCQARNVPLKILDVVEYSSQPNGYIDINKFRGCELDNQLTKRFGPPSRVQLSGERGIYMKRYGTYPYVLFKDCSEGTTYTNFCAECPHFPCEEGIHHLSLSTDGHLRPCRIRNDIFWDIRPMIVAQDDRALKDLVRMLLEQYYSGEFSALRKRRGM